MYNDFFFIPNFSRLSRSSEIIKEVDKGAATKQAYSKMAASKKPNAGPSTSRQGMIIHVSNRPQTAKVDIGKKAEEFPALGVSNKNKDLLYNDLSLGHSSVKVSAMPSKYSDLVVNAYESVDPSNFAKVTLIKQTTNNETKQKSQKPVVPKLDLTDNFPTLGKSESSTHTHSWVRAAAKNNQTREHKEKAAPAPDLSETGKTQKGHQKRPNQSEKEKKKMAASKKEMSNKINNSNDEKRKNGKNRDEAEEQNSHETSTNKNKQNAPQPPPGFNKGPPPGFTGVTLNSIARNENNLTFTSSLGEKFDIHPQNKNVYHAPADMQKRNQVIIESFSPKFLLIC
jgi:E3 ubiquitin-protein ligase ZNF598